MALLANKSLPYRLTHAAAFLFKLAWERLGGVEGRELVGSRMWLTVGFFNLMKLDRIEMRSRQPITTIPRKAPSRKA